MWSNMWSRKFYHIFDELSTAVFAGVHGITGEYETFGAVEPFWCSSTQTRRPTNWATPGYLNRKKCSLWSNMWSRKFYHSFAQLSTEVIGDNCEDKREYPTFGAVEPLWCSSTQTRWATPGNILCYVQEEIPPKKSATLYTIPKEKAILSFAISDLKSETIDLQGKMCYNRTLLEK